MHRNQRLTRAPPERDLWDLAETDSSVLAAYTEATGTAVDSAALALFRMWYDLSEIVGYICLFRDVHAQTEDAAESWKNLKFYLRPAERWPLLQLAEMSHTTPRRRGGAGADPVSSVTSRTPARSPAARA